MNCLDNVPIQTVSVPRKPKLASRVISFASKDGSIDQLQRRTCHEVSSDYWQADEDVGLHTTPVSTSNYARNETDVN